MKGTATVTTKTTVTPVTVTEVKNGTVRHSMGTTIIVQTDEGYRSFTQGEIDKRGVKIMREGKPALVSDFRPGDKLSATIITSRPPTVMTEQQVNATLAAAPAGGGRFGGSASGQDGSGVIVGSRSRSRSRSGRWSGIGVSGRRGSQDPAEDRQFVAARRARQRAVAGRRARPDDSAPRRRLDRR